MRGPYKIDNENVRVKSIEELLKEMR